jgi:hypothetical protein
MQTPPIFSTEEEFVGLVVDKWRPHSQGELELDIIEDVYESEFQKKGIFVNFCSLLTNKNI